MASAFGHAAAALAIGSAYANTFTSRKFWLLGVACSILPDADVLSFKLGVPYESFWGHRGFTHSLLFAVMTGMVVTLLFYRRDFLSRRGAGFILFFSLSTASHAILDALTTGGLGVAFFSPWDNDRYFFPWRPIKVSPIGVKNFFGEAGWRVIQSELLWIGVPCLLFALVMLMYRRQRRV